MHVGFPERGEIILTWTDLTRQPTNDQRVYQQGIAVLCAIGETHHSLRPRSTIRLGRAIRSIATGAQWSGVTVWCFIHEFLPSRTTESDSRSGPFLKRTRAFGCQSLEQLEPVRTSRIGCKFRSTVGTFGIIVAGWKDISEATDNS